MRILVALLMVMLAFRISSKAEVAYAADSVGHKWENGKLFVLHKVEKGQTAFAISRRYGTTVDAIRDANSGSIDVKLGQIIKVPYSRYKNPAPSVSAKPAPTETTPASTNSKADSPGTHTVEVGNTLFNIAGRYGVSVADLKAWNGLISDHVSLGQVLIISSGKYAENNAAPKVSVVSALDSARAAPVEKVARPIPVSTKPANTISIKQQGLAEKIEVGGRSSSKYLALHRDAPIGTLIQVTNQTNQEVIWVKVIGRIPNTSINDDIIVKLSGNAFEKISPQTRRFRAEITYSDRAKE